ncbi:hypothetical protein [Streptomyces sp. TLI_053]|uniref:hypothetical protein n=1 Tax=Streptomyces sp. TLI_053 TaxID=1855352 RepID=UPI0013520C72|nr:hypothetical protein [Streptomyces sp. TLI_053]
MKYTEREARALMAERGLTPLLPVPYPGNTVPWESECGNCRQVTAPTLASVRKAINRGQPKCCDLCRRNAPITQRAAVDLLLRAGAEPLEPYPGVKIRWKARCLNDKCRQVIWALLDSIKHAGTGACESCGAYGIKADDDALVYLIVHRALGAVKIGIAKAGSRRLALHAAQRWEEIIQIQLIGRDARAVERAVLQKWARLGLPYGVSPTDMPHAGYTETVSLSARSEAEVRDDLARALRGIGLAYP